MYRVRHTWENEDSQLGAYEVFQNAVDKANKYYGYQVFDDAGKSLYKSTNTTPVPYRVRLAWANEQSQLGAYDIYENAVKKANANTGYTVYDETGKALYKSTITVKTMSYKAKLLRKVGKHAKGSTVTVTRNRQKQWIMDDGTVIKDRSGYLDLTKQIFDPACKYDKATAEAWINAQGIGSATDWLFWCSKWCQKVYIFHGSKGHWVLKKVCKCGTGNIAYGDGSDQGVGFAWKIWDKDKVFDGPRCKQYWNQHYSSKWGNSIHQGGTGKPSTHGCIALGSSAAQWVFHNLPINTRVVVF